MDWIQIFSLFLANAGLVLWMRSESRNDWRHMDMKLDAHVKDTRNLIETIRDEMKDFHNRLALQDQEFKSRMALQDQVFKSRLCSIEERNRGKKYE